MLKFLPAKSYDVGSMGLWTRTRKNSEPSTVVEFTLRKFRGDDTDKEIQKFIREIDVNRNPILPKRFNVAIPNDLENNQITINRQKNLWLKDMPDWLKKCIIDVCNSMPNEGNKDILLGYSLAQKVMGIFSKLK